jgi:DNA-binding transcriptional regulator LsrR (DeoR family)
MTIYAIDHYRWRKEAALTAPIKGKLLNVLITDAATAQKLLEM